MKVIRRQETRVLSSPSTHYHDMVCSEGEQRQSLKNIMAIHLGFVLSLDNKATVINVSPLGRTKCVYVSILITI